MPTVHSDQKREVFILRLWRTPDHHIWRGQIQDVLTGQVHAIQNANEIRAHIQHQLEMSEKNEQRTSLK
jgi:hypothetical protein